MPLKILIITFRDKERTDTVIKIQVQDGVFSWMTILQIPSSDVNNVHFYLADTKRDYPAQRVRAVTASGSLIDTL